MTAAAPAFPGKRPKSPAYLYVAIFTALLVLLSAFALTARQPPPPTIAEFAPQAVEQIKDAPSEQSSEFGAGEGPGDCPPGADCGPGGVGEGLGGEPPPVKGVPRARKCIGDPPRQIEDPQSPPCVPFWSGDNGGATSKGVTENEIRIGIPDSGAEDASYLAFFNSRFEFYGRKLVRVDLRPAFSGGEPQHQRAAAVAADDTHKIFASTNATYGGGYHYYDELALRGIISGVVDSTVDESYLRSRHPYIWQYEPPLDRMLSDLGDWACSRLGGGTARHAGDPRFQSSKRVFGIVFTTQSPDVPVSPAGLKAALEACGHEVPVVRQYQGTTTSAQNDSSMAVALSSSNVTTVFCLGFFVSCSRIGQAASGQAYFPEWILSTYYRMDRNFGPKNFNFPKEQLAHAFGVTFLPRQLEGNSEPEYWAHRESNPQDSSEGSRSGLRIWNVNVKYRSLLLLASGIQMAGPRLTPETFGRALQTTRFPNPEHRNLPGKVGFNDGDHGMMNDMAEIWWSNDAESPYPEEERGSWCYVEGGRRRTRGTFPKGDDVFFSGECVTGARG